MKYIVYGIVSAAILFLSVLMFLTVEGRTDHEKTLEEAVSLALDQTMQEQWMQAESIKDDEAWADAFCRMRTLRQRLPRPVSWMPEDGAVLPQYNF